MNPHHYGPRIDRSANAPSQFPHQPLPRWSSPGSEVFPLPVDVKALVAVTVFTVYEVPRHPGPGQQYAPPAAAARCACGDTWHNDSAVLLRRMLGGHSCAAESGPVELVPVDDEPTEATMLSVLHRLREL